MRGSLSEITISTYFVIILVGENIFHKESKQFSMGWMKSKMILLFIADGLVLSLEILATHVLTNINI